MTPRVVDDNLGDGVVVAGDGGNPRGNDVVDQTLGMIDLATFPSEPTVLSLMREESRFLWMADLN